MIFRMFQFVKFRGLVGGEDVSNLEKKGKYWIWGLLKIEIWSESLVDNYQIVPHHNKVPLIPLAD